MLMNKKKTDFHRIDKNILQNILKIYSEERNTHRFGTTRQWENDDRNFLKYHFKYLVSNQN